MTDAAIELARQALEKRGVMVENNGAKTLRLAVVNVEHIPAMWIFRIVVDLQVEYGDGARLLFKGDNSTGGHMFRAYNGALMKAVAAMLNDAEIRAYLEH